jgi:hypothetical protein
MHPLRLRLLKDETEYMCRLAVSLADELEEAIDTPRESDAPVLVQGIISLAVKVGYLLWRFGRRVTDRYGLEEAEHLSRRLGLTDASPLAPSHLSGMIDLLTMSPEELEGAVDARSLTVTLSGVTHPLSPILFALRELESRLASPPDT